MKILLVNSLFPPHTAGGAEVVLRSQALLLQAEGHEVAVAAVGPEAGVKVETVVGVHVFRCGYRNLYFQFGKERQPAFKRLLWHSVDRYNPWMKRAFAGILDRFRPDIVWCHNLAGWSVSIWDALQERGIPALQVLHDQYFLCANSNMYRGGSNCTSPCLSCRILRSGHRGASRKVAGVVGVSRFVLDRVLSGPRFEGVPIREVLYNVKEGGLPELSRREDRDGIFRYGFIGGLYPNKGILELIEAFSQVEGEQLRLLVAGRGKSDFETRLHELASRDLRVEFLGFISPSEFYPRIDVLVVPSRWQDTLPTVVFEAQSYGIPVLGSRRGGIPEMIEPGLNGDLFEPDDPEELREKLRSLPKKVSWEPTAVQESARRFFEPRPWLDRFEEISRRALETSRRQ